MHLNVKAPWTYTPPKRWMDAQVVDVDAFQIGGLILRPLWFDCKNEESANQLSQRAHRENQDWVEGAPHEPEDQGANDDAKVFERAVYSYSGSVECIRCDLWN